MHGEKFRELNGQIDKSTIMGTDINTPLSKMSVIV